MVMVRAPGHGTEHGSAGHAPAPDPSAVRVVVCRRCGVVAPAQGTACAVCAQPLAATRVEAPAPPGDAQWVAVRCTFVCNSCKFPAPLDALDADGAVECAGCGLRQRFVVDAWREALDFAHAVGDLAGPSPEGRRPHPTLWIGSENPYAPVGDTRTFERRDGISESALSIDAAPGHPVCRACHALLSVTVTGTGTAATECRQCGDRGVYALADEARRLSGALLAAVADEHRTDRPRARATTTQAGVVALSCPGCGAPLTIGSPGRLQTCAFCRASCLVPRNVSAGRGDVPPPEVWWILFQGASKRRGELEAPTTEDAGSAVKAALGRLRGGAAAIGDAPGVYAAPEVPGTNWAQVGLTLLLGSAAVAVGFGIYEALAR